MSIMVENESPASENLKASDHQSTTSSKSSSKALIYCAVGCVALLLLCVCCFAGVFLLGLADYEEFKNDLDSELEDLENDLDEDSDLDTEESDSTEDSDEVVSETDDWASFSETVAEPMVSDATAVISGIVPADAVVTNIGDDGDLEKLTIEADGAILSFSMVYEAYPFTYTSPEENVVNNDDFGYLTRYMVYEDYYGYTNDVTSTGTCESIDGDLAAPCGSGAVFVDGNTGNNNFMFVYCFADSEEVSMCDLIMENLSIDYSNPY